MMLTILAAAMLCNGHSELCGRRYDQVTYVTTHRSMSAQELGFVPPSQYDSISKQLSSGVRGLMLEMRLYKHAVYLCHNLCELGHQSAFEALYNIAEFLKANQTEVVTLFLDENLDSNDLQTVFSESGLLSLTHTQPPGAPWPTLQNLIAQNHRVIVFSTSDHGAGYPWLHRFSDFAWNAATNAKRMESLICHPQSNNSSKKMMIFNNYLATPFSYELLAKHINFNPLFMNNTRACANLSGQVPNFISVDFHSLGDIINVTDTLNSEGPHP